MKLNKLSASSVTSMISTRQTSAEAVVEACLARIAARDSQVHAWAFLEPQHAVEQARRLDRSEILGPLHGVSMASPSLSGKAKETPLDRFVPDVRLERTSSAGTYYLRLVYLGQRGPGTSYTLETLSVPLP